LNPSDPLEVWRQWRIWLRVVNSGSAATVRGYTGNVLRFLAETGAKPWDEYTEQDCAEFLDLFAPKGRARHEYAKALRSIFRYCTTHMIVAIDPMEHIRLKKPRRVPPVTLTEDELVRILVAAVFTLGERVAWAILLIYLLGIRRMEAAGLKWEHILDGEFGPIIEIHETKGADQRDPLPLEPVALECLARLQELPAPPQAMRGPEYILRVKAPTISGWVHAAGTAAGLHPKKVGSHRLRASLATGLRRKGVDVKVVQKILGHLNLESTNRYFADADEEEVRLALARAGKRTLRVAS
jgi:integrase/recombinase XerD